MRFVAPAINNGILAIVNSAMDVSFHDMDDNGKVELWNNLIVKQAGTAPAPRGNVLTRAYNLRTRRTGNQIRTSVSLGNQQIGPSFGNPTSIIVAQVAGIPDDQVFYDFTFDSDTDTVYSFTVAQFFALTAVPGGSKTDSQITSQGLRIGTSDVYVIRDSSTANRVLLATLAGTDSFSLGTATLHVRYNSISGVAGGLWTLVRIDNTLCYASADIIVPVLNASTMGGAEFFPFIGDGQ